MRRRVSLALFAVVLGSLTFGAARVDADSVGTLQLTASLLKQFGPIDCAAGTAATTVCFGESSLRGDVVPGLGAVTLAPYTGFWENYGSPCGHVHAQIPILVAGKGEIDLAMTVTGCLRPETTSLWRRSRSLAEADVTQAPRVAAPGNSTKPPSTGRSPATGQSRGRGR